MECCVGCIFSMSAHFIQTIFRPVLVVSYEHIVTSGDYLLKNRLSQNTEHPFVDSHSFDKTENNSYLLLERVPVRARCEVFPALLTDWD